MGISSATLAGDDPAKPPCKEAAHIKWLTWLLYGATLTNVQTSETCGGCPIETEHRDTGDGQSLKLENMQ